MEKKARALVKGVPVWKNTRWNDWLTPLPLYPPPPAALGDALPCLGSTKGCRRGRLVFHPMTPRFEAVVKVWQFYKLVVELTRVTFEPEAQHPSAERGTKEGRRGRGWKFLHFVGELLSTRPVVWSDDFFGGSASISNFAAEITWGKCPRRDSCHWITRLARGVARGVVVVIFVLFCFKVQ